MRGFRPRTHFGLFVLCILLVALAWIRVCGQHVAASATSSAPGARVIEGEEQLTTSLLRSGPQPRDQRLRHLTIPAHSAPDARS